MRQRAVVIGTRDHFAEIEVSRSTMCDGCEKNGGCSHACALSGIVAGSGKMRTTARNTIGAAVGDTVEVETASRTVLWYAALVFLMPIAVCALFYFLADAVWDSETIALIAAAVGFVLSFLGISVYDRSRKEAAPEIEIVAIVTHAGERGETTPSS
ncbi:MAG: SoxR reducing system RseC family protein [Eubacteriales bacterium]